MTTGTIVTKDTRLYFSFGESEILRVECLTGVQGIGAELQTVQEPECFDSVFTRQAPTTKVLPLVTLPINLIPTSAAHQALESLHKDNPPAHESWMVVMSDQTGTPSTFDSDGHLESPGGTTVEFKGYVTNFAITGLEANGFVQATVTVQMESHPDWTWPSDEVEV